MPYCGIMFILLFLNRVTLLFVGILTLAISLSIVNILPHGRSAFSDATNSRSDKNCVPFNYSTSLMTVGPIESYGSSFNSLIILMFNHFSSNSIIYRFNFCPWLVIFVTFPVIGANINLTFLFTRLLSFLASLILFQIPYSTKKRKHSFSILKAFFVRHSSEYETSDNDRKVNRNI